MLNVDVHPCKKVCVYCLVSLLPNPPHVCPVMMSLHINFLAVCVVTMHQDTNSKLQKIQNLKQPTDNILWFIPFLILTVLGSGVCVCVCVCVFVSPTYQTTFCLGCTCTLNWGGEMKTCKKKQTTTFRKWM